MANKGILVCAEVEEGKVASISAELLGCAKKLAKDLGDEIIAVVMGSGVGQAAKDVIPFGAGKVYVIDSPLLKDYTGDGYLAALEKLVKEINPQIVLLGQTALGRDLAPRLAFRLNTGLAMDCVDLSIDPQSKALLETKPVYGGNARAVYISNTMPQVATIRGKAMSAAEPDAAAKGEVIAFDAKLDPSVIRTKFVKHVKEEVAGIKLEDAQVIITGGRGVGGPDGFKQLEELAKVLHGAVGATRPPCDNGWVPSTIQIGLTGKIVVPNVYIAIALSGSSQHMAGCSGAKNIIAINKDSEANIFKEARFGIVGDWKQALPALTAKIKQLTAK